MKTLSQVLQRVRGAARARFNPPSTLKAARRAGVRLPAAWLLAVAVVAGRG